MISRPNEGPTPELDIDLWSVPVFEMDGLLDAVSIDCFIDYAFNVLLRRAPDPSGSMHYRQRVVRGHSRQSVVADLLASAEYRERHGERERRKQPIEEFVNQSYQDILDRWPDENGRQTYMRIGRKWRGRSKVENNLFQSPEAFQNGGGRLARIRALQAYAAQARRLKIPIFGLLLRRHNALVARLVRIEWMLAMRPLGITTQSVIAAPAPVMPLTAVADLPVMNQPSPALPDVTDAARLDHPLLREARIETLDTETATKLDRDGWVFRVAVRDARRKEMARARPAARSARARSAKPRV